MRIGLRRGGSRARPADRWRRRRTCPSAGRAPPTGRAGFVNETTRKNGCRSVRRAQLADALDGAEADLVVVVGLVGRLVHAGVEDAGQVVVPREPLAGGQAPIRRPVESGRVDVGGQTLLEPVQLIGPDEVHLAREDGVVAARTQQMGDRRRLGGQLGGVVEDADRRRPPPRQHRRARGRAQRRGAVGALERHARARERRQVRRLHHRMAVAGQERGRELVGHQQHDVRPARAHAPVTAVVKRREHVGGAAVGVLRPQIGREERESGAKRGPRAVRSAARARVAEGVGGRPERARRSEELVARRPVTQGPPGERIGAFARRLRSRGGPSRARAGRRRARP